MSTAIAAARAKTKGKRMLRDAVDAYGDDNLTLSHWNERKKRATQTGKWTWKEGVVSTNTAIKARFEKKEVQQALKTRFVDIQVAMEEELGSTVHTEQHGGAGPGEGDASEEQCCWRERIGGKLHHCVNLVPSEKKKKAETTTTTPEGPLQGGAVRTKRFCFWHARECVHSEHPMETSRVLEVPNKFGLCLSCYEATAGTQRATLQKVPPRLGASRIPGVCLTDFRQQIKRDVMLKRPVAGSTLAAEGGRHLGPTSVCTWQKEHSERNYVWRCTNRVVMHPVLRGSYLSFCGFHAPRCIQEYGSNTRKERACPGIERRNRFGLCRNHLEAYLSGMNYEERGKVALIDSEFDVPGIKECKKEVLTLPRERHPLAPKYPPPALESAEDAANDAAMDATTAVVVLPGRPARIPLKETVKKVRGAVEQAVRLVLESPNPVSVLLKEAVWQLRFMRRAAVVATRIQRIYRGNRARRRVRRLRYEQAALSRMRSCRVLQRFVRGFLGRRRFQHEFQAVHEAIPHLQRLLRGALARKKFRELCAAIRLQRNYRLYRQRLLARTFREEVAYMQGLQRQSEANWLEMQAQVETFRRLRARRVLRAHVVRWKHAQESREKEAVLRLRSLLGTVKIQRQWRRYQRCMQLKKRYESAQMIQKRTRGWLTRHMWHGDPGVRFVPSFVSLESGFEYGNAVILSQPSRSYSYPNLCIRSQFGALTIQRVFRGHLGRLAANTSWAGMLKRWEWLGITPTTSSGETSDSMTVGHERYDFLLPSFAYHRDRRHHMRPIDRDPLPNRGHAYKYQFILDLIKDRDGKRGWSLAQERMYERQQKKEEAWLEAEEARRSAKEVEVAAKALRKRVVATPQPLAKSMPISKALFPVGAAVDVAVKLIGKEKRRLRRGRICAIHKDARSNGETTCSFDVEYDKPLRNSYGRLEVSGEQRVCLARLEPVPLVASERHPNKSVDKLIQTAIDNLRSDILAKQNAMEQNADDKSQIDSRRDTEALPTMDAIADRLRDCREGFDLLRDHRDFVDFAFRNSTILQFKWLQVVSCVRYGISATKYDPVPAYSDPIDGRSAMALLCREFGLRDLNSAAETLIVYPMPERADAIEQRMAKLGFQYDPSANIHEETGVPERSDTAESAKRPETTLVPEEGACLHAKVAVHDDMMLSRGKHPDPSAQDLHRLIYELKTLPREGKRDQVIHITSRRAHAFVCGHPACGKCFSSRKAARLHQTTDHEARERLASANPTVDQYLHTYWPPGSPWNQDNGPSNRRMVGHFCCSQAGCERLQFCTRRDLNSHLTVEHDDKDDGVASVCAQCSPPAAAQEANVHARQTQRHGVIWLGTYVTCRNLDAKLGIASATLMSPGPCFIHGLKKPNPSCTTCFLQRNCPVYPCRLYSTVAVPSAKFSHPSVRMDVSATSPASDEDSDEKFLIFRVHDDDFCPAVSTWDVYSLTTPKRKARGKDTVPDPFSKILYLKISAVCRDAVGDAWIFGHALAHRSRVGIKDGVEAGDEREVICDDARGLVFAQLSQVVGAATIRHCSKHLFYRKYCTLSGGSDVAMSADSTSSASANSNTLIKELFCRPSQFSNAD